MLTLASCEAALSNAGDPPERVGRIGYVDGETSLQTGAGPLPRAALLNWPLTTADRIATSHGAHAELSFAGARVWLDADTEVTILSLDEDRARIEIGAGAVAMEVSSLEPDVRFSVQVREVETQILKPGNYRFTVSDTNVITTVRVGESHVDAGTVSFQQLEGETARVESDGTVSIAHAIEPDSLDRWSEQRQSKSSGESAALHVSRSLVGYEDLDAYGAWRSHEDYGMVWEPQRVAADWAPYRFGDWIWIEPWGWTWVDDAPWGFAPSHYGRWLHEESRWLWVPGPREIPPVFAPGVVGWTEDFARRSAVGWFPLAPRERYAPLYAASEQYLQRLNSFATTQTAAAREPAGRVVLADSITWGPRSMFAGHPPIERRVARRLSGR